MGDSDSRAGHARSTSAIVDFLDRTHAPLDPALEKAFNSPGLHGIPAIMISRSEGRFLNLLMTIARAERIVEVGTLAGFSTIHLARALGPKGHLWTIENDAQHAQVAQGNIESAGLGRTVTIICDEGLDGLASIESNGPFDGIFIDADKGRYDRYVDWAAHHLRPGGLLLVDNAYFFGQLMDRNDEAAAVRRMHESVGRYFDAVCVPTPEGMLLAIRRDVDSE